MSKQAIEDADNASILEYIDQQKWLLSNGMVNDAAKNQLFMYGSIVHKEVKALELEIEPGTFEVRYKIYVDPSLIKKMETYKELSQSTSLWGMWRFKRMLNSGDQMNFAAVLNKFVKDFCGAKWHAKVDIINISSFNNEERDVQPGGAQANK